MGHSTVAVSKASSGRGASMGASAAAISPTVVGAPGDGSVLVGGIGGDQQLVELGHAGDAGHRHQVGAAKSSDLPLHATLFMRPVDPRPAVEAVEEVVAPQGHEAGVLQCGPGRGAP